MEILSGARFTSYDGSTNHNLTVEGNCVVENGGKLTGNASAITLGTLKIENGGEYSATSGTTTITSETGNDAWIDQGTFTHNKGLVKIAPVTDITDTIVTTNTTGYFYDFEWIKDYTFLR